jgi:hypothetical protein
MPLGQRLCRLIRRQPLLPPPTKARVWQLCSFPFRVKLLLDISALIVYCSTNSSVKANECATVHIHSILLYTLFYPVDTTTHSQQRIPIMVIVGICLQCKQRLSVVHAFFNTAPSIVSLPMVSRSRHICLLHLHRSWEPSAGAPFE